MLGLSMLQGIKGRADDIKHSKREAGIVAHGAVESEYRGIACQVHGSFTLFSQRV
jgi:hypothetical protein